MRKFPLLALIALTFAMFVANPIAQSIHQAGVRINAAMHGAH